MQIEKKLSLSAIVVSVALVVSALIISAGERYTYLLNQAGAVIRIDTWSGKAVFSAVRSGDIYILDTATGKSKRDRVEY